MEIKQIEVYHISIPLSQNPGLGIEEVNEALLGKPVQVYERGS